jgi:hypothetical protein
MEYRVSKNLEYCDYETDEFIYLHILYNANLIVAFHWQNEIISLWNRSIILFNIALVCLLHAVSQSQ